MLSSVTFVYLINIDVSTAINTWCCFFHQKQSPEQPMPPEPTKMASASASAEANGASKTGLRSVLLVLCCFLFFLVVVVVVVDPHNLCMDLCGLDV